MKRNVWLVLFVFTFGAMLAGCGQETAALETNGLSAELGQNIKTLKADKAEMEDTIKQLQQQVSKLSLHIHFMERLYDDMYAPSEPPTFWNSFDWVASQVNVLILLLFVIWLLYILYHRQKNGCDD